MSSPVVSFSSEPLVKPVGERPYRVAAALAALLVLLTAAI